MVDHFGELGEGHRDCVGGGSGSHGRLVEDEVDLFEMFK